MPFSSSAQRCTNLCTIIDSFGNNGEREAVVRLSGEGRRVVTFAELARTVGAAAGWLRRAGLERGDRAIIMAENSAEWISAALAVIRAGGIVIPLDVQTGTETLGRIIEDAGPKFVFTSGNIRERFDGVAARLVLLDDSGEEADSWAKLCASPSDPDDFPVADEADPVVLFYTSGTTGLPKGVPLTHGNLVFEVLTVRQSRLINDHDRILLPLPLNHVYPFVIGMLSPLALGLPIVFPKALTGPDIVKSLQAEAITAIIGVPRLYRALYSGILSKIEAKGPKALRLFSKLLNVSIACRRRLGINLGRFLFFAVHRQFSDSLRLLASGGSALDTELAWKLQGLGWNVAIGYGLTETSPLLTINQPDSRRPGSVGRAVEGVEIRILPPRNLDSDRAQLREGQGEVVVRGPNVFAGYRQQPELTREVLDNGWFRTGDLGYFDDAGYLYLTGRASTLIVTEGGKNIQPDEVEEAFEGHPLIAEIGILQKENRLAALIVPDLAEISRQAIDDIAGAIRQAVEAQSRKLPSYQRVVEYHLTRESLPRTRLGKIRRHLLEQRYQQVRENDELADGDALRPQPVEDMSEGDRDLLNHPRAREVWEWLARKYHDRRLTPDSSPQLDLGIDSLEWVNVTLEIRHRFGVGLDETAIARIHSVRGLLEEVLSASKIDEESLQNDLFGDPERSLSDRQRRWLMPLNGPSRLINAVLYYLNWLLMRALFRFECRGKENIPDYQVVMTPNHGSYLDPPVLAAALGFRRMQRTYWGGWTGVVFNSAWRRFGSRIARVVPIDPERGIVSSLAFGAAVLQRQSNLVWFPEGHRSADGGLDPFKPGAGVLISQLKASALPVYIRGAYDAMPPGAFFPRPRKIIVIFGRPVTAAELEQEGKGEEPHLRIVEALRRRVQRLGAE